MEGRRNRRYFIKGEGEVSEEDYPEVDLAISNYMSSKHEGKKVEQTEEWQEHFSYLIERMFNYIILLY